MQSRVCARALVCEYVQANNCEYTYDVIYSVSLIRLHERLCALFTQNPLFDLPIWADGVMLAKEIEMSRFGSRTNSHIKSTNTQIE